MRDTSRLTRRSQAVIAELGELAKKIHICIRLETGESMGVYWCDENGFYLPVDAYLRQLIFVLNDELRRENPRTVFESTVQFDSEWRKDLL